MIITLGLILVVVVVLLLLPPRILVGAQTSKKGHPGICGFTLFNRSLHLPSPVPLQVKKRIGTKQPKHLSPVPFPPKGMSLYLIRGPQMGGQIRHGRIGVFGAPRFFSPEIPKYLFFKGFWDLWTENRGRPQKTPPNSTTTDLTPHLRPSEFNVNAVDLSLPFP